MTRAESVLTGIGAFLFPTSGFSERMHTKGMSRGKAGRPQGVYKHVSPINGQPVHVFRWRKEKRMLKKRQKMQQEMARLAKKGVTTY